eukprot:gene1583-biopygen19847
MAPSRCLRRIICRIGNRSWMRQYIMRRQLCQPYQPDSVNNSGAFLESRVVCGRHCQTPVVQSSSPPHPQSTPCVLRARLTKQSVARPIPRLSNANRCL